jgi:hypothetical protein
MPNSRHYLNDKKVNEPRNWQDIEVTIDWSTDKIDASINLDNLEFVGQTAIDIISRMNGGLSGGVGFFEGEPYRIEIGEPLAPALVYEGYLDFTDNPLTKACDIVEVSLKQKQGVDWLTEVADTAIYRYMASDDYTGAGKITNSDYLGVPYVINYVPDGTQLLILSISTFMLTKELIENIKAIAKQTSDLVTNAIPTTGVAGIIPVVAYPISKIILSIIKLTIQVIYTIGIIFAIIELVKQIVEQLAPVKRFHLGMPIRSLFQKGCDFLGLGFSSTLIDALDTNSNKWVLIPSKSHKGGSPPTGVPIGEFTEVGYPTSTDGLDTLGDVIRTFKQVFNADIRLNNGVLEFERRDYWQNQSGYVIPNTFNNQEQLRNETTVNTNEIKSNIVISWNTDQNDLNTLDNPVGRILQAVTSPKIVNNPELVNIKGLQETRIPFSMGVRKDKLTVIEEVLKVFLGAADFLTGQLGQPQGFASQFNNRIGSLNMSSHFLGVPKMVVMNGSKLANDQRDLLSAKKLWDFYHFIESFVTINDKNNQQVIVSEQTIPFCFENFVSLSSNNFVEIETGEKAEIIQLTWKVESNSAVVTYRVYKVYDENLKITILT